jgi:hypothetical protein
MTNRALKPVPTRRASRYPKAKNAAEQWMNHMREERARKSS